MNGGGVQTPIWIEQGSDAAQGGPNPLWVEVFWSCSPDLGAMRLTKA